MLGPSLTYSDKNTSPCTGDLAVVVSTCLVPVNNDARKKHSIKVHGQKKKKTYGRVAKMSSSMHTTSSMLMPSTPHFLMMASMKACGCQPDVLGL